MENNTQMDIEILFSNAQIFFGNFKNFLKEKNRRYGDSALKPVKIFNKTDSKNSILIRLDDKINRIINSDEIRKNDMADILGYVALYMIANGWTDFDDLLD